MRIDDGGGISGPGSGASWAPSEAPTGAGRVEGGMEDAEQPDHVKALAVARVDAMKPDLSYRFSKQNVLSWEISVRPPDGGAIIRYESESLFEVIDLAHGHWAPACARQRQALRERALKFDVAEVADVTEEFDGVQTVDSRHVVYYAQFFDSLKDLEDQKPTLVFNRMAPGGWELTVTRDEILRAPTLRELCGRLEVFMQRHYQTERDNILAAAREIGIFDPEEVTDTGIGIEEMPPVVIEPRRTPAPPTDRPLSRRVLLVTGALLVLSGVMMGLALARLLFV